MYHKYSKMLQWREKRILLWKVVGFSRRLILRICVCNWCWTQGLKSWVHSPLAQDMKIPQTWAQNHAKHRSLPGSKQRSNLGWVMKGTWACFQWPKCFSRSSRFGPPVTVTLIALGLLCSWSSPFLGFALLESLVLGSVVSARFPGNQRLLVLGFLSAEAA